MGYQLSTAHFVPNSLLHSTAHFVPNVFFSFDSTFLYQMYITFNGTLQLKMFYFAYQRKILFGLLFNFSFFLYSKCCYFILNLKDALRVSKDSRTRKQWFPTSESFEMILFCCFL